MIREPDGLHRRRTEWGLPDEARNSEKWKKDSLAPAGESFIRTPSRECSFDPIDFPSYRSTGRRIAICAVSGMQVSGTVCLRNIPRSLPFEYDVQCFAEPDAIADVFVPRVACRREIAQTDLSGLGELSFQVGSHDHGCRECHPHFFGFVIDGQQRHITVGRLNDRRFIDISVAETRVPGQHDRSPFDGLTAVETRRRRPRMSRRSVILSSGVQRRRMSR